MRGETTLGSLAERLQDLQSQGGLGRSPADLLTQAKLKPEIIDGDMIGMQVNEIQSGSLYEKVGLQDGDIITSVNGIALDSAAAGSKILPQLTRAKEFEIELPDRTITVSAEEVLEMFGQ